jgi:hypothetical protein
MKKKSFGLLLILIFFLTPTLCSKSNSHYNNWEVVVGTTTNFILDTATWSITFQDESAEGEIGRYNSMLIEKNSEFSVKVLTIDKNWGINYQIQNASGVKTTRSISTPNFRQEFTNFLFYHEYEFPRLIQEGFNETNISLGPPLPNWFFIEPTQDTWDFLEERTNSDFYEEKDIQNAYDSYLESIFERTDSKAVFDCFINGYYQIEEEDTDLDISHNLKFVWDEFSGILAGLRIASSFSGTFQGYSIKEEMNIVFHKKFYNLPDFKFGNVTSIFPISGLIIGFISILFIVSIYKKTKSRLKRI